MDLRVDINFRYYTYHVKGHTLKWHRHPDFEFERVILGANRYAVEGYDCTLSPGPNQLIVFPDGLNHNWELTEAPIGICRYWVAVEPMDDSGVYVLRELRNAVVRNQFVFDVSPEICLLEKTIWDLMTSQRPVPVVSGLVNLQLQQLIILFFELCLGRNLEGILKRRDYVAPVSDHQALVDEIERFIEANHCKLIQLQDLCDNFHFSSRHLNRIFNEVKGCSVGDFIKNRKADIAKDLLINTSRTVKEIGFMLGYCEVSHFSRFFCKAVGLSPLQFRTKYSDAAERNQQIMNEKAQH